MTSGLIKEIRTILAKGISRDILSFFSANVLSSALPVLLLPIITRHLSAAEYGAYSIFLFWSILLFPLLGMSANGLILVRSAGTKNKEELSRLISNVFCLAGISCIFFLIAQFFLSMFFGVSASFLMLGPYVFGFILIQNSATYFQCTGKRVDYFLLKTGHAFMTGLLSVIFCVFLSLGSFGLILAATISVLFFASVVGYRLRAEGLLAWHLNSRLVKGIFNFGLPLLPHAIGSVILTSSDRWILEKFTAAEEVGVYSVGAQLAAAISLVTASLNQAYAPRMIGVLKSGTHVGYLRVARSTILLSVFVMFGGLISGFVLKIFIGLFFKGDFLGAVQYVGPLAIGFSLQGLYQIFSNVIFFKEKTGYLSRVTVFCAILHIFLLIILVRNFGGKGAAITSVLSWGMFAVLSFRISEQLFPLPWRVACISILADCYTTLRSKSRRIWNK